MQISKEDALIILENSGKTTINQAALYVKLHHKAAGDYVNHAESCENCSQKTNLIKAMSDLEATAATAMEALKDFQTAEAAAIRAGQESLRADALLH